MTPVGASDGRCHNETVGGASQVRVRLLGGLQVEGLEEREIGSRKGRTLLKLLVLARGAAVSADRIVDVLWGDDTPSRPADQVGVLVSRLRAVLGADRVTRTDAGYALRVDWLDLDEIDERVAEAERRHAAGRPAAARAAAEAALALVRGPLVPDEDGEWVEAPRAAAARLVRRAQLVLTEAATAAGDHGAAVAAAEDVLDADPYDEAALRALMRAHVAAGRPASALAAYVRVRERLAEDLGIPPSEATEELHDAIVLGDATPAPALPATARPVLAGRSHELAALRRALSEAEAGESVLVVLEGEAGIGKTALLDTAAGEAAGSGFVVVRSSADVLGRDLPLQPVLDALAAALRAAGPEAAAAALAGDVAVLEHLLGWRPSIDVTTTVLADAESGRARLFAALLATLERLAAGRPLLVVVDDVHVADQGTVEWLGFATRRGHHLAALAARRPSGRALPAGARVVPVGPLDVAAAAALVGEERAQELHARSGGNPLFLVELARSGGSLPATILDAVSERTEAALGVESAAALRMAAVLSPRLDLDLLAGALDRPVSALLADAEAAVAAGLLVEDGTTYAFAHELLREALATGTTAARRAFVHRQAARVLAARSNSDQRTVAWHARQGGDAPLAAAALLAAASSAALRYDRDEAERLLDEAVALDDGPAVRLARARVRMAGWALQGAAEDADRGVALEAGAAAFEVRGWVAYYARDYDAAQRYADEGADRSTESAVRASCLSLAGRTRHARGELVDADQRLAEAAACPVPEVRSVAQGWLAALRAHQGRAAEACELAERALLEPARFGHPFVRFHGQFARALGLGMRGRLHELVAAVDRLEGDAAQAGSQGARFVTVAMNLRSWPLRTVGRHGEAASLLHEAIALTDTGDIAMAEPHNVAVLDLAETMLLAGDVDEAWRLLAETGPVLTAWTGTMAWRARQRHAVLEARALLAKGHAEAATARAIDAAVDAEAAGNVRHMLLARCVTAEAGAVVGRPADHEAVDRTLAGLDAVAGLEAWLVTGRLAAAYGVERWWADAERRADAVVAAAGPLAGEARRHVERSLAELRRRG